MGVGCGWWEASVVTVSSAGHEIHMEMCSGREIARIQQRVSGQCAGEMLGNLKTRIWL